MEVFKVIVWPLAIIIIVITVVLILKKEIKEIFARVTKIGYGDIKADLATNRQNTVSAPLLEQQSNTVIAIANNAIDNINRLLGMYNETTIDKAREVVERESRYKELNDPAKQAEVLFKYSEALYLVFTFEKIYNAIFGSQLYILDFLNTNDESSMDKLKVFYDGAVERHEEFFKAYSYNDYFNFLIVHQLVLQILMAHTQ